jgi:hypothetical protein
LFCPKICDGILDDARAAGREANFGRLRRTVSGMLCAPPLRRDQMGMKPLNVVNEFGWSRFSYPPMLLRDSCYLLDHGN